jgi:hypothetical protein
MAFNVPIQQPLTGAQSEALSKLSSMNNLLTIPFKKFFDRPKSQQISLLDFLTKIADATLGVGYIDNLIMSFINRLFDKGSDELVSAIIKGLAAALDAKPITIKQGISNKDWLDQNVKQELNVAMELLKALLIKKIIILIYGPKDRIKPLKLPPNNYGNNFYLTQNYTDLSPDDYLDNASLSDVMFTTVNTVSNTYGDVEYNIIKLREQLEKGIITFTVSCQDVKINLPESILQSADAIIDNNIKVFLQGQTVGGGQVTYQNPAGVLVELNGYVDSEAQRINSEENAGAIRKSWIRILLDKIINLLPLVLYPILQKVLDKINLEIQAAAAGQTGSSVNVPANIPVNEQVATAGSNSQIVITASMLTTIVPGTFRVSFNNITMTDNGSGSLSGPSGEAGTIDYNTGVGSITLTNPLPSGTAIMAQYEKTPNDPFAVNVPILTVENTLGLLTSVKNDISKDRSLFDKNSTFYKVIMNGIYALVLSLILKKLIPKITKLITKALAKRKANQLARKFKRYQARAKLLQEQAQEIEKKAEAAQALKALKVVYDYIA